MKKNIIISIILMSLSLCLFADNPVALTLKAVGDISLTRNENVKSIGNGDELFNEDVLESKENSFAAIKFIDGSAVIKLFPKSILTINAKKNENNTLDKNTYLKVGEIWAKVVKKTGEFEIDTPTTVVSVKGTRFYVKVDETGTIVKTYEGAVKMTNKSDGESAMIGAGETGSSDGDGEIEVSESEGDEEDGEPSMDDETQELRINLENDNGDVKTVIIEFE